MTIENLIVSTTNESEVRQIIDRIKEEQYGQLDILVKDIWGGDELTEWNMPFWQLSLEKGRFMLDRAVQAHILTSRYAIPLMVERNSGLVVEVTDGINYNYRGQFFYSLAKVSAIHLAEAMSSDFQRFDMSITALACCLSKWDLSTEYSFTDVDGSQPHWENFFKAHIQGKFTVPQL